MSDFADWIAAQSPNELGIREPNENTRTGPAAIPILHGWPGQPGICECRCHAEETSGE